MVELVATIVSEKMRFNNPDCDVVIWEGVTEHGGVTLKGVVDELGPNLGGTYRFHGKKTSYFNRRSQRSEPQFHYRSFVPHAPRGRMAVVKYLTQIPGVGQGMAEKLWDAFGEEAIERLAEGDPLILSFNRFTEKLIEKAVTWLDAEAKIRDSIIEVTDLLEGRSLPKSIVLDAIKEWGARAALIIRKNPFLLMRFRGCGFRRAERMYLDFGHNPNSLKRQIYAAQYLLEQWGGSTWNPLSAVERELRGSVSMSIDMAKLRRVSSRAKMLVFRFTDGVDGPLDFEGGTCWVSTKQKADAELRLANRIKELIK